MRLVYATNFYHKRAGALYGHTFSKLLHGLIRAGHYVYPFSANDMMRLRSPTGHLALGARGVNRALIEACETVQPDVLLLGHAKAITAATLTEIRRRLPGMMLAQFWVDAVWDGFDTGLLTEQIACVDGFFLTTAGHYLERFGGPGRVTGYFPTPADATVDRHRAFEASEYEYDAVFFGSDVPDRNRQLQQIRRRCPELRLGLFGCLGSPRVWGVQKEAILARSKMAMNLSRRNDIPLCTSNRLGDTTANGVMNLCPASAGLQALYREHEAVYYDGLDDLVAKLHYYAAHDDERRAIAEAGWRRSHEDFSAERIARFFLEGAARTPGFDQVPWPRFILDGQRRLQWQDELLPAAASQKAA